MQTIACCHWLIVLTTGGCPSRCMRRSARCCVTPPGDRLHLHADQRVPGGLFGDQPGPAGIRPGLPGRGYQPRGTSPRVPAAPGSRPRRSAPAPPSAGLRRPAGQRHEATSRSAAPGPRPPGLTGTRLGPGRAPPGSATPTEHPRQPVTGSRRLGLRDAAGHVRQAGPSPARRHGRWSFRRGETACRPLPRAGVIIAVGYSFSLRGDQQRVRQREPGGRAEPVDGASTAQHLDDGLRDTATYAGPAITAPCVIAADRKASAAFGVYASAQSGIGMPTSSRRRHPA